MVDQTSVTRIARQIFNANQAGDVFQPLRGDDEPSGFDMAYAIQDTLYDIMQSEGQSGPLGGHKIALTSPDIQKLCGVDQPVYGGIVAKTIHRMPFTAKKADFHRIGIEFEVAFEIGETVDLTKAPFDQQSIQPFVKNCMVAFELIEDRNADYSDLDAMSILTDRCWCGGVVLGEPAENWCDLDLAALKGVVTWNGETLDEGVTGNALGHPLNGLAWIANHLAARGGSLSEGDIVMSGSALKTRFAEAGDTFSYTVDGLGHVSMSVV